MCAKILNPIHWSLEYSRRIIMMLIDHFHGRELGHLKLEDKTTDMPSQFEDVLINQ